MQNAKLDRGVFLPVTFPWHRPHWDACFTQYWRSARGFDPEHYVATLAEAGFTHPTAADQPPYVGQWVAKTDAGARVASIRIDEQDNVWVNDTPVEAKRVDGVLQFRQGTIVYTIQGDRGLKNEDFWADSEAGTKGPITLE